MAAEVLSVQPTVCRVLGPFSSGGLMVSLLRTRLEATTIGIAQTLRLWLKAGLIKDSVMGVMDLNTKNHCEGGSEEDKAEPQRGTRETMRTRPPRPRSPGPRTTIFLLLSMTKHCTYRQSTSIHSIEASIDQFDQFHRGTRWTAFNPLNRGSWWIELNCLPPWQNAILSWHDKRRAAS